MRHALSASVRASRGLDLNTKGRRRQMACRLPLNNLKVALGWKRLIVHGGRGKAARDRDCCFRASDMLEA